MAQAPPLDDYQAVYQDHRRAWPAPSRSIDNYHDSSSRSAAFLAESGNPADALVPIGVTMEALAIWRHLAGFSEQPAITRWMEARGRT